MKRLLAAAFFMTALTGGANASGDTFRLLRGLGTAAQDVKTPEPAFSRDVKNELPDGTADKNGCEWAEAQFVVQWHGPNGATLDCVSQHGLTIYVGETQKFVPAYKTGDTYITADCKRYKTYRPVGTMSTGPHGLGFVMAPNGEVFEAYYSVLNCGGAHLNGSAWDFPGGK